MATDDVEYRFLSHARYIEAFAWLAGLRTPAPASGALVRLKKRAEYSGLLSETKTPSDMDAVATRLRNAWGTELLLSLPFHLDTDDEFVRLTNTWGVIQTYYVGYHMTQALVIARGGVRPESHPKTQNLFADLWSGRRAELAPWTLAYGKHGAVNVPSNVTIDDDTHNWTSCDDSTCWSHAVRALRTSRQEHVTESQQTRRDAKRKANQRAWDEEEAGRLATGKRLRKSRPISRPILSAEEKQTIENRVRAYTVLDYLYRLRVRANYHDASLFTDGPTQDYESAAVNRQLRYLAASTSLVTELRIQQLVGRPQFARWMDRFIDRNVPGSLNLGVAARRDLVCD
jgi:hypothetical protein